MLHVTDLQAAIEAAREHPGLGRSPLVRQLFDYLAECSLKGRSPKESEVAIEVFGRLPDFDSAQDAVARVYVHKLRKRLEAIENDGGPQLTLPRGEYRFVLREKDMEQPNRSAWRKRPFQFAALAFLAVLVAAGVWQIYGRDWSAPAQPVAKSAVWNAMISNGKPIIVVVGDYYIFADYEADGGGTRLVREFTVNSARDLEEFRAAYPARAANYRDLDLQYLPVGAASALVSVANALAGTPDVRTVPASRLTPSMIRDNNIVYVGFFSGLGILRDPTFAGSRYAVGETYDDIIDTKTSQRFESGGGIPGRDDEMYPDVGYLSTFAGPNGTRVIVIAGTRDAALSQAGQSVVTSSLLDQLSDAGGRDVAAEALIAVSGIEGVNLDSRVIRVSGLDTKLIWGGPKNKTFPSG